MKPSVLNKSDLRSNGLGVYCGRPSKWGNPFKTGIDGNRTEVIEKHKNWFLKNEVLMKEAKLELKGKNLICWCSPKSCHCDVILIVANDDNVENFFE